MYLTSICTNFINRRLSSLYGTFMFVYLSFNLLHEILYPEKDFFWCECRKCYIESENVKTFFNIFIFGCLHLEFI